MVGLIPKGDAAHLTSCMTSLILLCLFAAFAHTFVIEPREDLWDSAEDLLTEGPDAWSADDDWGEPTAWEEPELVDTEDQGTWTLRKFARTVCLIEYAHCFSVLCFVVDIASVIPD